MAAVITAALSPPDTVDAPSLGSAMESLRTRSPWRSTTGVTTTADHKPSTATGVEVLAVVPLPS